MQLIALKSLSSDIGSNSPLLSFGSFANTCIIILHRSMVQPVNNQKWCDPGQGSLYNTTWIYSTQIPCTTANTEPHHGRVVVNRPIILGTLSGLWQGRQHLPSINRVYHGLTNAKALAEQNRVVQHMLPRLDVKCLTCLPVACESR